MSWEGSDRRQHLPSNWRKLREQRFEMDGYQCTHLDPYGVRCEGEAEECDHIGHRTDHRLSMLRSLCKFHHGKKTGAQGAAAAKKRRKDISKRFRRDEPHPGAL